MQILLIALFFLTFHSQQSNAAVFERDLFEPDDGLLTYDDVNQREWLDLTYTAGMTANQIASKLQSEPALRGFQIAVLDDIIALSESSEVYWMAPSVEDPFTIDPKAISPGPRAKPIIPDPKKEQSGAAARNLLSLLGPIFTIKEEFTNVYSNTRYVITDAVAFGQIDPDASSDTFTTNGTNVSLLYGSSEILSGNYILSATSNGGFTTTPPSIFPQALGSTGPFWLYREAIPEPSTMMLLCVATTIATTLEIRPSQFLAVRNRPTFATALLPR